MNTKIVIDEKACLKHKMTLEEFLVALMYRQVKAPADVSTNLINREVLVVKDDRYWVTQHWSEVIDEIICDSSEEQDEERLLNLAKEMRECFPEGKMRNTAYYYRCNNAEVIKKLKKFFTQYGNYTDEEIIDATKRYIASCNRSGTPIKLVKYFISKEERGSEEGTGSLLLTYLDNKDEGKEGVEVTSSDEWLMNSRN